jgi:hypothetical protein
MNFIKPTKQKIYAFLILLVGLIIPIILSFLLDSYYMRTHTQEEFGNFLLFLNTPLVAIISFFIYLIWLYIVISFIYYYIFKKK